MLFLDAEEERYRIEERNKVIDKANQLAFESQDRVKAFKSKLMMCDNYQELKQQAKLKCKRDQRDKEIEQDWVNLEKQQMKDYDNRLQTKLEQQYKKKVNNANMIQNQLHEFKNKYVEQLQEEYLEGQLLKRKVEEDIEDERRKEMEQILLNKKIQQQQIQANHDLEEIKRQQREKELEEERKIAEFAKKKER